MHDCVRARWERAGATSWVCQELARICQAPEVAIPGRRAWTLSSGSLRGVSVIPNLSSGEPGVRAAEVCGSCRGPTMLSVLVITRPNPGPLLQSESTAIAMSLSRCVLSVMVLLRVYNVTSVHKEAYEGFILGLIL